MSDWHTEDFPPLRPHAPWLMEEMIHDQRLVAEAAASMPGAETAAAAIASAADSGRTIEVVGCGSSEHAALAIAALIREGHPTARVAARQALDAAEQPTHDAVLIGVSHDGGTRATELALQASTTDVKIAITGRADSAVAAAANTVVVTPRLDQSWCHTIAYTSAIIAGAAVAGITSDGIAAGTAPLVDDAVFAQGRAVGQTLAGCGRIATAGMGIDHVSARELALKIEEGARLPATAHHLETLLHGHLAGCDAATTHVVLFATDPAGDERRSHRASIAIEAVSAIGIPITAILPGSSTVALPAGVEAIRLAATDEAPVLGALLGAAYALQAITLGLVDATGWNPDLIRRESAPYRAAALLGDDGGW